MTTTRDNWVFPFERAPQSHSMDFVLRPGERLIRYFEPDAAASYYLPYARTESSWAEFPKEISQYNIRTEDGPRSQKDARRWATGRFEYLPPLGLPLYEVRSPYVIIDARFEFEVTLASEQDSVLVETTTDGGRTWQKGGVLHGPHRGAWSAGAASLTASEHGRRTAVSGTYGYLMRFRKEGDARVTDLKMVTLVQLNPRTLPSLVPGRNELVYRAGAQRIRRDVEVPPSEACAIAKRCTNATFVSDGSQGYWAPEKNGDAEIVLAVSGNKLASLQPGGRVLDLSAGLAPDKLTAEVRKVTPIAAKNAAASISWSASVDGPFQEVWKYSPEVKWLDGKPVDRLLRWPEVDRSVELKNVSTVYVRYRFRDLAMDHLRIEYETHADARSGLEITHEWHENGVPKSKTIRVPADQDTFTYSLDTEPSAVIENRAVVFEAARPQ